MMSMGSTDLLSSEKWFKSEIALPPRGVDTSNGSFNCDEEEEESGPCNNIIPHSLEENKKQSEITTPAETPEKCNDYLLHAAKQYMSTKSTAQSTCEVFSTAVYTNEKLVMHAPFLINDSLKKPE
jgi:hypothetical protein